MPPTHAESYYAATARELRDRSSLRGDASCDVCVVGGGFTGLSSALHLAERGYSVILLEAQRIGWGASGRNGGQIGSGQRKGQSELEALVGLEEARRLWALAEEAKEIIHERVAIHEIDCDLKKGVMVCAHKARDCGYLSETVDHLRRTYAYDAISYLEREEVEERLGSSAYHGAWLDWGGGHLHPLNYALGLARAAEEAGALLYEASPALSIQIGGKPSVVAAGGRVKADHLVIATNGYLDGLCRPIEGNIMPINNYIIATEPLGERFGQPIIRDDVAVNDTKFVVDYYRLSAEGRLLFGGGETYRRSFPRDIEAKVRPYMLRVFPQLRDCRIDYAWGGTLAITMNRLPDFGRLKGKVFYAQGFSGHGVALTSLAGKLIAEAVAGTAERFDIMARLPTSKFPGGTLLRWPGLVAGMLYYSLRDKL